MLSRRKAGEGGLGDLKKYGFPYFVVGGFAAIRTCVLGCLIFINKNKGMGVFYCGTGLALHYRDNHYIQR